MFYILILPLIICFVCSIWTILAHYKGAVDESRQLKIQHRENEENDTVFKYANNSNVARKLREWIG